MERGTAGALVEEMGDKLIGRLVFTLPYGDWPGGQALVKEINPDPGAPEIVMTVVGRGDRFVQAVAKGKLHSIEIGVFDYEPISLMEIVIRPKGAKTLVH